MNFQINLFSQNSKFNEKRLIFLKKIILYSSSLVPLWEECGSTPVSSILILLLSAIIFYAIKYLKEKTQKKDIISGILFSVAALILSAITAGFITSVVLSIVFVFLIALQASLTFSASHN